MNRPWAAVVWAGLWAVVATPGAGLAAERWEVTVAVRVAAPAGQPVSLRVALPPDGLEQRLLEVQPLARGLRSVVVRDGEDPHVQFEGLVDGSRRVAVTYRVEIDSAATSPEGVALPAVAPVEMPSPGLLPFLRPAPLFQSRSILVRQFLERQVAPLLADGRRSVVEGIFEATRRRLAHGADGKTLPLDVVRRRRGRRIGIERAFTTFLRCARIPARFVEGIRLDSSTSRKRVFWTELWAPNRWWPISASQGWMGQRPATHLAVARDGRRAVHVERPGRATYRVETKRIEDDPALPRRSSTGRER